MKFHNVPELLIDEAIAAVAGYGLERATTKAIVQRSGMNEAYIYRYYTDKDDLLVKMFDKLDEELLQAIVTHLPVMQGRGDHEARCRQLFCDVWRFLLGNSEKCLAFIRYYYSPYFTACSLEKHQQRYAELTVSFGRLLRAESNVWMLLNHILYVMLDFAVKVFNGQIPDNEDTAEHVFRLVYYSVCPYFVQEEESISV